jgi:anti-sigma factor ChrR (cupin superfamily)
MPLHEFDGVGTALVRWAPNTVFNPHVHPGGEEILVLEGVFHDEHGSYPSGTWIRSPRYSKHTPFTKSEGALIYVKTGHLNHKLESISI